jgi:DNA topoisomerase-3
MILVIAEKPSVARDIARVIGANEQVKKTDITYYQGGGYIVANAMGHFLTLSEPSEYGYEWGLDKLPMCPQKFTLSPIKAHIGHLKALSALMNSGEVDSLIEATDAGREGELIFRYIYYNSGCGKPFQRLWISSLTDESILGGMENLRPSAEKDRVFHAGYTRAKADWLVGMNLSRLYILIYRQKYTVGRVQTPTLAMIAQRDFEIDNFKKTPYFTLELENGAGWFGYDGVNTVTSFPNKQQALAVQAQCEGKTATVEKAETKRKNEQRPQLFSLTSLQKEANEKHGFSAARTLVTMQDLYEKKLLTYPRTDAVVLTEDMKPLCVELVQILSFYDGERTSKLLRQGLNFDKRVIDNDKVTDHHAIIPTADIAKMLTTELTPDEKIILDLVIRRFLAALDKPRVYDETEYVFNVDGEKFSLVVKKTIVQGWREYEPVKENETNVKYNTGDSFTINKVILKECETEPPKRFTESTLLSAMEHISRRIDDKEKSEFVKERGLGTPATRAAIIERLITLDFIERRKKQIISTENGREFLKLLPPAIKSVELTADIESMLADIESGKCKPSQALNTVMGLVNSVIETEKKKAPDVAVQPKERAVLGKCPKCGCGVAEVPKGYICTNKEKCTFALWKNDFWWKSRKKELTPKIVSEILQQGKAFVKGLYSEKTQKKYDAYVVLDEYDGKDGKKHIGYKITFEK